MRLVRIAGRWSAHPGSEAHRAGEPADGVVAAAEAERVTVALFAERPPAPDLCVVGCDPAFGIVAETLRGELGIHAHWAQKGSRAALALLARGQAHVAGVHLRDPGSGGWNASWVEELVPFPCTRVTFATWEQGLLLRPETRRQVGGVADLAQPGVRLVNREPGSGSRSLLDQALAAAGLGPADLEGYDTAARGHLPVADAVAAGAADVGVAIRAAARARGLDLIPLREEAYELVVPDHFLDLPAVDALLRLLRRPSVRAQVEALGGYDAEAMGRAAS